MIIGNGIDLVELKRTISWLDEKHIKRILSLEEIEYLYQMGNEGAKLCFIGGRFAAKEAIFKAISQRVGHTNFSDIVILNDNQGKPYVSKHPFDQDLIFHISISHTDQFALAQAIIEKI